MSNRLKVQLKLNNCKIMTEYILNQIESVGKTCFAFINVLKKKNMSGKNEDFLDRLTSAQVSNSVIELKVGALIMLIANFHPAMSLKNGTKLCSLTMFQHQLLCTIESDCKHKCET